MRLWGSSQNLIQNLSSHKANLYCQFLYPKPVPNTFLHQCLPESMLESDPATLYHFNFCKNALRVLPIGQMTSLHQSRIRQIVATSSLLNLRKATSSCLMLFLFYRNICKTQGSLLQSLQNLCSHPHCPPEITDWDAHVWETDSCRHAAELIQTFCLWKEVTSNCLLWGQH